MRKYVIQTSEALAEVGPPATRRCFRRSSCQETCPVPRLSLHDEPLKHRRAAGGPTAFTLIELLTLVAIIAIIAAIAVPNFLEVQVRSKVAASLDEMHTLSGALEAYWLDHRVYPPNLIKMVSVAPPEKGQPPDPAIYWFARLELADGRWLCETSESVIARMAFPPAQSSAIVPSGAEKWRLYSSFNDPFISPLPFNGLALRHLTTPVAYAAGTLPFDRFISGAGTTSRYARCLVPPIFGPPDAGRTPFNLGDVRPYGYYDLTAHDIEGMPLAGYGRTVTHVITSPGPSISYAFTNPACLFPCFYDPTNGTVSVGSLVVANGQQ